MAFSTSSSKMRQAARRFRLAMTGAGRRLDVDALVAAGHLARHVGDVGPLGQARLDRRLEPLHEPGQVARPDDEAFQQLSARLLRSGATGERLRHAEDHGHRGAELVAQAGDELVAAGGPFEQGLLRDLELTRAAALALQRLGQLLDDGRRELGEMMPPPDAASRTAFRISSPSESLSTYPEAPATSMSRTAR